MSIKTVVSASYSKMTHRLQGVEGIEAFEAILVAQDSVRSSWTVPGI